METLKLIIDKAPEIIGAVSIVLSGLAALFMVIPGEQPEKTFKAIGDFLAKFSRK
jgi:hypothetical protein